jgi:hypothetical protein
MNNKFKTMSTTRPIWVIANDILADWQKVNYAAKPYLDAMLALNTITDTYYKDSAKLIIAYFLSNATTWRGAKARQIKEELNNMITNKY